MSRTEKTLYQLINVVARLVLKSPAHALLSGSVVLLSFTGRKSGKRYSVPVGYVLDGEDVVCFTGKSWSNWWKNLAGGVPANVRLRGRNVRVRARIVAGEAEVARGLAAFLIKYPKTARRYGVSLDPEGRPDPGAVTESARGGDAVMIRVRASSTEAG